MQTPILANLTKPTKSVYKGVIGSHNIQQWNYHQELTRERILSLLSIILLPISIGLYGASIAGNELFVNNGDLQNIAHGNMGYRQMCYIGIDNNGIVQPKECATISSSCDISYSLNAQQFQQQYYGTFDSKLNNCTEFNAYRATNVMAIIFAGVALIAMIIAHLRILPIRANAKVKIFAFITSFLSGSLGVIAQCVLIDWWYFNMQNLVTLAITGPSAQGSSTPLSNVLSQSLFDEVGGWVCALCSSLIYIVHFPSAIGK